MRLWGLFAVALLSCYRAPQTNMSCTITCSGACPGELTCEGGFCVEPGQVCRPAFVAISAGTGFACGIDANGSLGCWGSNQHHQISQTDQLAFPLATRIDTSRHWETIASRGPHVCRITA